MWIYLKDYEIKDVVRCREEKDRTRPWRYDDCSCSCRLVVLRNADGEVGFEIDIDDVILLEDDLEKIVEKYKYEIIDILLRDHYDDLVREVKSKGRPVEE